MSASFEISVRIEQAAWEDLFDAASTRDRSRTGLRARRLGSALLLTSPGIDHPLFNRVIGPGMGHPCPSDELELALRRFEKLGIERYFVHLHDSKDPELRALLRREGLERYHRSWTKLLRGRAATPDLVTALETGAATAAEGSAWTHILAQGFDLPSAAEPLLATLIGRPRWHAVVARDAGTPVAAGAMFSSGGVGYLAFAATLPSHRGRGAQGALMVERIRRAVDNGCRWIATETGEAVPGDPNHSFRNMLRCGFTPVGSRENWVPRGSSWSRKKSGERERAAA